MVEAVHEKIEHLLTNLPGVIGISLVGEEQRRPVREKESEYEKIQLVPLRNTGIQEVLARDIVYVLLKDDGFRPPPTATVYLAEEADSPHFPKHHLMKVGEKLFRIVGEEVMDKGRRYDENHVVFHNGLILYPHRRSNRQHVPAFLLIPPVPFPELDAVKDAWGIDNIMSVSPSARSDDYLRESFGLPKNREYATILVGCDLIR